MSDEQIVLKDIMHENKISFSNIIGIVVELTKTVEKMTHASGLEKKFIVIDGIRNYILNDSIDNEEQRSLLAFVDHTLPHLIDLMILLDKSEFMIKMKKKYCFICS